MVLTAMTGALEAGDERLLLVVLVVLVLWRK
jgi:hypothetical protein